MSSTQTQTRERILRETWRLMEAQRGQGVRLADIARAAGVSRQAIYLHFASRAELLIATVRYVDEEKCVDAMLGPLLAATNGVEFLDGYVEFWGNYIPEIYGLAKALLAARDTDEAAAAAWDDRMAVVRRSSEHAIECLQSERMLAPEWEGRTGEAVDMLWSMLSIRVWEQLVFECGRSSSDYIEWMRVVLRRSFVKTG